MSVETDHDGGGELALICLRAHPLGDVRPVWLLTALVLGLESRIGCLTSTVIIQICLEYLGFVIGFDW